MGWALAHAGSSASVDSTAYTVPRAIFLARLPFISVVVFSESYPASFHNRTYIDSQSSSNKAIRYHLVSMDLDLVL